ncbi:MAG: hypothetical protein ACRELF_01400 [Gemmataceae bacterium]
MRTQAAFQKCAESVIAQVHEHWAIKKARLDELIGAEDPEETQLDLRVHCEEANHYVVRAILHLPSATLTAEARDADVRKALDCMAERLAEAVQQHRGGGGPMASAIDEVEIASTDSFPASDPPSWTHVTVSGPSNG